MFFVEFEDAEKGKHFNYITLSHILTLLGCYYNHSTTVSVFSQIVGIQLPDIRLHTKC